MRSLPSICILLFACFLSCSEDNSLESNFQQGTFTGTFQRVQAFGDGEIAHITLIFDGNEWSGSSDITKYPALCRGTYSIKGSTITFANECPWTAEFDWSLILSGDYELTKTGNKLEFSRDYRSEDSDTYLDQYVLVKNQ